MLRWRPSISHIYKRDNAISETLMNYFDVVAVEERNLSSRPIYQAWGVS